MRLASDASPFVGRTRPENVSASGPWQVATPTVTANATRTQWYDDGPPKTASKPGAVSSRYYRVIVNP